jgi:pimeloyl-ACP methyl ester carboxylesterase
MRLPWRAVTRSVRFVLAAGILLAASSCRAGGAPSAGLSPFSPSSPTLKMANVGGYSLAYQCQGTGSPTVILEAGYTASGIDTYGQTILPLLARTTRVCTYDRAGDGISNPRPNRVRPLTGATQAGELHTLLRAISVGPPYIMVGHSYGGMLSREFAALYPGEVVGMVLIDASSEPEIPVYQRLHAGPWIDGTVTPAPNQRIDIDATVRQLEHASSLGAMPLVVITAGILQDRWLRTAPHLEAVAQTRLAMLSANSIHVLDGGIGHLIPTLDPRVVIESTQAVIQSVRVGTPLQPCTKVFRDHPSAECLSMGKLAHQQT